MTFYANKFKRSNSIQGSRSSGSSQPRLPFTFEQRQKSHMKILELNNQMKCFNCEEIGHWEQICLKQTYEEHKKNEMEKTLLGK